MKHECLLQSCEFAAMLGSEAFLVISDNYDRVLREICECVHLWCCSYSLQKAAIWE
jgi:hypothetical protein